MGLSEEGDDSILQRFDELCLDLNMDRNSKDEALQSYHRTRTNFTLEGDQLHWLACSLYEACRRSVVPTVGRGTVEGNCVSLTRLLRSAQFSLIQFFNKMKKWADMASLAQEFRDKVNRLERNFNVSTVIFKKLEPIFLDIFRNPADDVPRQPRSRKQRRMPCSITDILHFCWTMFVQVKGNFPAISDDLVNSYHLLLCCCDWFFANALLGGRRDLLNPAFVALPENFHQKDWKPPSEAPCIIQYLCDKHEGLVVEAKGIKEHYWKQHIRKLFEKRVLKGKIENVSAILETGNFELNCKAINHAYEEYVLSVGDFDERIFLGDDADEEIGTPAKFISMATGELVEKMHVKMNLQQHLEQTKSLAPMTPLTGRRYLKEKDPSITPVSTATQSVSRLQALLSGRRTCPSDTIEEIFKYEDLSILSLEKSTVAQKYLSAPVRYGQLTIICKKCPTKDSNKNLRNLPSDDHHGAHIDFAKRRLQLAESLYYKTLENITLTEKRILENKDQKEHVSTCLQSFLDQDVFHRSLFACCQEIVIFSYNSQRTFPWIVDIFDLSPYYFYKVVEIVIRAEEGLSRDVVKHLNHIEESILESMAWKSESPIWDAIKEGSRDIPTCEEVTLPNQMDSQGGSPLQHPIVKKLVGERTLVVKKDGNLSVTDRFSSPAPGNAKRRLFGPSDTTSSRPLQQSLLEKQVTAGASDTVVVAPPDLVGQPKVLHYHHVQNEDGRQILIPVSPSSSKTGVVTNITITSGLGIINKTIKPITPTRNNKPKKTGSLALFFRNVYHLVSVRLRDLCSRLEVTEDLQQKMWTCIEQTLVNNIDLMMDRHLDQLLMCAVYVMAKVTDNPQSFHDIMKCYRLQPQYQSHVYRSVLLSGRRRRISGGSDSSKNGSTSPVNADKEDVSEKERERKRKEEFSIRSTSTLPVPHPSSQPPTPTKLSGLGSSFDFSEERGDLITFYNNIFVKKIRNFALKFSSQNLCEDSPPLSPLPVVRTHPSSPRRVSSKHNVYISPHKNWASPSTPTSRAMQYRICRSPHKDLCAINNMLRMGEKSMGKRCLEVDQEEEASESPSKRMYTTAFLRRLQTISSDRQEANGSA